MLFEWFVLILVLCLVLLGVGGAKRTFVVAFIGAILLLYLGTSLLFEGIQERTNPDVNAIGNNYKITYNSVTTADSKSSLSVYLLGWIFAILGIALSFLSIYQYIYLPSTMQKKGSDF
jgi:putative Mn2+ efflux pump MntP